jgi:hypothetical protein
MGYNNIPDSVKQYLPGDFQTNSSFQPEKTNFLTNNKFIFILNRCPNIAYFCQRANIPSVTHGVSIQNNPMAVQIQRPGTSVNLEDLQIGFAVDEQLKNWIEIFTWIKDITVYGTYIELLKENQKVSDASLLVLNSAYRPILNFKFYDVFPNFLSGLDFDTTLPDTDNIIASVNFSYNYFDVETLT